MTEDAGMRERQCGEISIDSASISGRQFMWEVHVHMHDVYAHGLDKQV